MERPIQRLSRRILIVDDERRLGEMLKLVLEQHEYHADAYSDPREAVSDFEAGRYDLVILDVKMPRVSGFEVYRRMIGVDAYQKVLFLTASEASGDHLKRQFPWLQPSQFIQKPVAVSDLLKQLEIVVRY